MYEHVEDCDKSVRICHRVPVVRRYGVWQIYSKEHESLTLYAEWGRK